MNASLTDRYVTATVRDLDDEQRAEVERELRTTIEDMIDGRLQAGAPSRPEAERAVLAELGDPVRLAAGYSGRPLYLIGRGVYPQWRRVMTVLLTRRWSRSSPRSTWSCACSSTTSRPMASGRPSSRRCGSGSWSPSTSCSG